MEGCGFPVNNNSRTTEPCRFHPERVRRGQTRERFETTPASPAMRAERARRPAGRTKQTNDNMELPQTARCGPHTRAHDELISPWRRRKKKLSGFAFPKPARQKPKMSGSTALRPCVVECGVAVFDFFFFSALLLLAPRGPFSFSRGELRILFYFILCFQGDEALFSLALPLAGWPFCWPPNRFQFYI